MNVREKCPIFIHFVLRYVAFCNSGWEIFLSVVHLFNGPSGCHYCNDSYFFYVKNLPYGVLSNCGICDDELEDELPTLQAGWTEVRSKVLSSILQRLNLFRVLAMLSKQITEIIAALRKLI